MSLWPSPAAAGRRTRAPRELSVATRGNNAAAAAGQNRARRVHAAPAVPFRAFLAGRSDWSGPGSQPVGGPDPARSLAPAATRIGRLPTMPEAVTSSPPGSRKGRSAGWRQAPVDVLSSTDTVSKRSRPQRAPASRPNKGARAAAGRPFLEPGKRVCVRPGRPADRRTATKSPKRSYGPARRAGSEPSPSSRRKASRRSKKAGSMASGSGGTGSLTRVAGLIHRPLFCTPVVEMRSGRKTAGAYVPDDLPCATGAPARMPVA